MYDNANHIITNNKDKLMLKNDEKEENTSSRMESIIIRTCWGTGKPKRIFGVMIR